ncbi:uncharacterized protein N7518_004954 [Penicillium psychrosexuale]|uniref:uncharacterized protein n=1 Tax=Penicillium psychrosexuale TaxID=1002107 RepID=UPI0025453B64|nr:uncharacterized protein N7518_004954 [Penicillium psychrosexuale]KAJ5796414.1 hypothetical protein N7518_004954 [Penicillium psychrosexuale]
MTRALRNQSSFLGRTGPSSRVEEGTVRSTEVCSALRVRDYEPLPNVNPAVSRLLHASVEIASGINLTNDALDVQCCAAAQNRLFDLIVNNCLRFCTEILQRLVNNGTITQDQFDALAEKGFQPLV